MAGVDADEPGAVADFDGLEDAEVVAAVTMGNVLVSHIMAFMMQTSPAVTRHKIAGVLGTSVLGSYRKVIFDVSRHEVIFELRPPSPPLAQTAKLWH